MKYRYLIVLISSFLLVLLFSCGQTFSLRELVDGPDGKALAVSPSSGTVQINGSLLIVASGGIPPYRYTILSGSGNMDDNLFTALSTPGGVTIRTTDDVGSTQDTILTIVDLQSNVDYQTMAVDDITYDEPLAGSAFSGKFSIRNNGSAPGTKTVNWLVYTSVDTTIGGSDDRIVDSSSLPGLSAGATTVVPFGGTWPSEAGTYYLLADVYAVDDLEPGDNQNQSAEAIPIYANLVIIPASVTVYTGQSLSFSVAGGTGSYQFFLSPNESGGTLEDGLYTAGLVPGTDTIEVRDAMFPGWAAATALVTVTGFP